MFGLLDNPAWSALTTTQAGFARGGGKARRYAPGILPFAAFGEVGADAFADGGAFGEDGADALADGGAFGEDGADALADGGAFGEDGADALADGGALADGRAADLDVLIDAGEQFYVIGELPALPANWALESELPCAQLLAPDDPGALPKPVERIEMLGPDDREEMFALIDAVQPGYYLPDTRQLGEYFGIRRDGRLVAMAGERMRLTGFCEISAVCTSPDYTGNGYAQQLIGHLCRRHAAAGTFSFLHVSLANARALRLYEHLGFRHRRDISFFRVRKVAMH